MSTPVHGNMFIKENLPSCLTMHGWRDGDHMYKADVDQTLPVAAALVTLTTLRMPHRPDVLFCYKDIQTSPKPAYSEKILSTQQCFMCDIHHHTYTSLMPPNDHHYCQATDYFSDLCESIVYS